MSKKITRHYYLDRDTDTDKLTNRILENKKADLMEWLKEHKNTLQGREAGDSFTLKDDITLQHGELENMQRFFRGAVVPYYFRQKYNYWHYSIPSKSFQNATNELKKRVGFIKYNHKGKPIDEVNSMTTFKKVEDLNEFLTMVQEVCFDDEGFIFPDSEYFKKLEKEKGRAEAQKQVFFELYEKYRNKFYKREILD